MMKNQKPPSVGDPHRSRFISIEETALALGLGLTTTKALIASGDLPSAKLGRRRLVNRNDVSAFIRVRIAGKRTAR
jgi:excisionase family DNA binding protein